MNPWNPSNSSLHLPSDEIHVWKLDLDVEIGVKNICLSHLSKDENLRMQKFKFEQDRNRFATAHGIQRILLSRYTKIPACDLVIMRGAHGKPYCANEAIGELHFNLSYSHDIALFAITKKAELGVDVEWINPDFDINTTISTVFSEKEKKKLYQLLNGEKLNWFFKIWTHKEAILKCLGTGLLIEPDLLDLSFKDGSVSIEFDDSIESNLPVNWSLFEVNPGENYSGALATNSESAKLQTFLFEI